MINKELPWSHPHAFKKWQETKISINHSAITLRHKFSPSIVKCALPAVIHQCTFQMGTFLHVRNFERKGKKTGQTGYFAREPKLQSTLQRLPGHPAVLLYFSPRNSVHHSAQRFLNRKPHLY